MKKECPYCFRPITREILDKKAELKSQRVKDALAMAKSLGEPVGRPRDHDRDEIMQLRQKGLTIETIAERVGCSMRTVSRAISELGEG